MINISKLIHGLLENSFSLFKENLETMFVLCVTATMEQFSHPHIIKLLGIVIEKPIYIIMEFAQLGEVLDITKYLGFSVGADPVCWL